MPRRYIKKCYIRKIKTPYSRQIQTPAIARSRVSKSSSYRHAIGGFYMTRKDPFPPRYFCKFVCTHSGQLTSTNVGTAGTERIYRLTSLWDPEFALGGRQPYGRDTMATIYGKYRVRKTKVELVFSDPSADGLNIVCHASNPSDTTATNGQTINQLCDLPMTVVKPMNNSGEQVTKITKMFPAHKVFGVTKTNYNNDDNYEALMGADPAFEIFLRLNCVNTISGVQANTVNYLITETFYTECFDRKPLPDNAV